jgi:HK97 gp10 family phage protein
MASEIEIKGLSELHKLLQDLPAKVEANVLRGGIRAGSKVLEQAIKDNVPVRLGALRDSIKVKTTSRRGTVQAVITAGNVKAFYASWVEFGTAQHYIKPKNRKSLFFAGLAKETVDHPGSTPKPYMRPALDENSTAAVDAMAEYIRNRLPKEFSKL